MEFRFANPSAFQLLWLVPIIVVLGLYLSRSQVRKIKAHLGERLAPFLSASLSMKKRVWKIILQAIAVAFFVLALARPQAGESQKEVKSQGVELMLVVDVSQSMLAEDVKPSRMELAKKELNRFLNRAGGDQVGLIAFAGSAVMLSPLTSDTSALKMYIDSLTTESVSTQGTEFKEALLKAEKAFERGGMQPGEDAVVTRAVVIASDGENNEPGAKKAAKRLAEKGIRIFTLGFGTKKGGPIPLRDDRGRLKGYLKNDQGEKVLSKTKGTVLKSLADEGGGSFHHVTLGGSGIEQLSEELDELEKAEFDSTQMVDYKEEYQKFLLLGLIIALIELLLGERRQTGRIWKGRFEVAEE